MDIEIERVREEDFGDYVRAMFWAAGRHVDAAFIAERRAFTDLEGCLAAFDGPRLVATVGTRSLAMTVPGGSVLPVAAIGQGGVLPSHTRRGIMRRLMERSFALAMEHDVPLAAWTTSEWPLYERYGGGPATFAAAYELEARGATLRDGVGDDRRCELVELEALLPLAAPLHEAARRHGQTLVARDAGYWSVLLGRLARGEGLDFLDAAGGKPPPFACVHRDPGGRVDGMVVYRIEQRWRRGLFRSTMELQFFVSSSPAATAGLWRFLLSLDLVDRIRLPHRPVDDPLRWMLVDGRRLQTVSSTDHVWVRIMDVPAALGRRAVAPLPEPLVIRVHDPMIARNAGTFAIDGTTGVARVERTGVAPDVTLDVGVLSSLYLGGCSLAPFLEAGRLVASSPAHLERLARLFAGAAWPFVDNDF